MASMSDKAADHSLTFPATANLIYKPAIKAGKGYNGTIILCTIRQPSNTGTSAPSPSIIAVKVFNLPHRGITQAASALQSIKEQANTTPCANIIPLLELIDLNDQSPWYSMHAVRGCTVQQFLEICDEKCRPVLGFHVLRGCASAIRWFKDVNLCYCDFTTQNVMLQVEGTQLPRVILVDVDDMDGSLGWDPEVSLSWLSYLLDKIFPGDMPDAWREDMGLERFRALEELRDTENLPEHYGLKGSGTGSGGSEAYLNWLEQLDGLLAEVETCYDPDVVEDINKVVADLWGSTEAKLTEVAQAQGNELVVDSTK